MLNKKSIFIISCILSLSTFDIHAMLTRFSVLSQAKKTNFRRYTTQQEVCSKASSIAQSSDLIKVAAQQFVLKDLTIPTMHILSQHNKKELETIEDDIKTVMLITSMSAIPIIGSMYTFSIGESLLLPLSALLGAAFISTGSIIYTNQLDNPDNKKK